MKINRLNDLEVFVMAAQCGNFSDAARQMGIAPVVASAIIKRLEAGLGVRLFERSTRSVRLSDAGERYLPHARAALAALDLGANALQQDAHEDGRLQGLLRLSMPSDLGRNLVLGWLETFIAAQNGGAAEPASAGAGRLPLQIELRVSDRLSNLLQQPVDFALRYGTPDDSGFVALPIAPDNRRALVASPAYLARYGEPQSLPALLQHNCLRFVVNDALHGRWQFEGDDGPQVIDVSGDRVADDGGVVRQWALAGLGVACKSRLDVAQDLASGALVELLPHLRGEPTPLYLLVVSKQRLNAGVRALAQALARQCQALLAGPGGEGG